MNKPGSGRRYPINHKYDYVNYPRIVVFLLFLLAFALFFIVLGIASDDSKPNREVIYNKQGFPIVMIDGTPLMPEDMK